MHTLKQANIHWFSQALPKMLANLFFLWYDFGGFVYPFWGKKKIPEPPECNFYVTDGGQNEESKREEQTLRTTKRGVKT